MPAPYHLNSHASQVLTKAPVAATFALREMGKFSDDGAGYLQKSPAGVVSALVKLVGDKNTPPKALIYTAQVLLRSIL